MLLVCEAVAKRRRKTYSLSIESGHMASCVKKALKDWLKLVRFGFSGLLGFDLSCD